ncbi:MAG: arginase family protein, partial [Oscillospiraceae bacterium]|nr:arginase family protein [Oscillospiraceae bacterium]
MQHKKLEVIGIQMDMGASKRGVSMGPAAIRYGGLVDGLEKLGYAVRDLGDILPLPEGESRPNLRNYEQVIDINRKLYHAVSEILERG